MTDENYDLYWGIIVFKDGRSEAIVATSEQAYYAYEEYHEGSRVGQPDYGWMDSIKDFDIQMLHETCNHHDDKIIDNAIVQTLKDKLKGMTSDEKVSYILQSFDM